MRLFAIIIVSIFFTYFKIGGDKDDTKIRADLIQQADTYIGYAYDARNSKGFDCSGFVQTCFREMGYELPRSSREQNKVGTSRKTKDAQLGDVIVFTGSNSKNRIPGHVGIVHHIQNDTLYFIHASSRHGIIINHLEQPYYTKRFLGIRNMLDDENLLKDKD